MLESSAGRPHPAVRSVARRARALESVAQTRLSTLNVSTERLAHAIDSITKNSRLTLNFHPDRRDSMGRTVAAGLLADRRYRPQFETGISNGGRTAVPGGDRARWETDLFDGAYDDGSITRPVYGALDLFQDPYGGSPRFGSCFVVLKAHCRERATFCVGDSHLAPSDIGTMDHLTSILAGAAEACSTGNGFGRGLSVSALVDSLSSARHVGPSVRELDRYIESQVHGGIDLARDVAAVVLDPSFRQSAIERDIEAAANRYGFDVGWNEGSEVWPDDIDPEFRGSSMQELARRSARPDGLVDAAAIGRALYALPFTPPSKFGDPEESPLQRYKKLWHCCLRFGSARS